METLLAVLVSGFEALWEYLGKQLAGAFIPAFFVAGGVSVFIPKSVVVRYLSPRANRVSAYLVASVAGSVLSVCSCGIIPLFAAFYQQGAGLGPAVTFLFAGPSINLISMFYGFYLLGPRMGATIAATVILTSIALGLVFQRFFAGEPAEAPPEAQEPLLGGRKRSFWATFHFFLFLLLMTLLLPIRGIPAELKLLWVAVNCAGLLLTLRLYFQRDDIRAWLEKSLFLVRRLLPRIVIGIFLLGVLQGIQEQVPGSFRVFRDAVGTEGLAATGLAALVGALVYMGSILATLTVKALMGMGMAGGPAVAFVVAAPGVSFSTLFAVAEIVGWRRSLAYYGLVIVMSATAGWLVGIAGIL